jgi:nitrate/TMAO reductase-like tetraheme cytochrome c subunit
MRLLPKSFFNPLSLIGGVISGTSFGLIVFLFVLENFGGRQNPYVGIIAFVILPAFLLLGLALAVIGMILENRRRRKNIETSTRFPSIDLNDPHQRSVFGFAAAIILVLLLSSAFGSYQAYEYTDSTQFCGQVCHTVMKPEYTSYLYSPHARVTCAECHVGSGAGWYVRSKLSGAYQVYATLFNKYSRPIPTPVQNLRPAQATCEQCHWPKKFYAEKLEKKTYFLSDENNTRFDVDLLMKIGGGNPQTGPTSGIHWHMNIENKIMYVAVDSQRQDIPWVSATGPDGKTTVYVVNDGSFKESMLKTGETRRMDCIDCHNRPTHIYRSPNETVNQAMALGWINPKLPSAKSIAVNALVQPYTTEQGALDSIGVYVRSQYAQQYPRVSDSMKIDIDSAVAVLRRIYSVNFFPEMNVSWLKYPDNVGHLYYAGCFRCHDGKHVSSDGKVIPHECNTCHEILDEKTPEGNNIVSLNGVPFVHPADVGTAWKEMDCDVCHTGE